MIQHTLSSLEKLKELNLSNNRELGTLNPKEIPRFLTKLTVNNTNLRYLPILSAFKNLMTLNVSDCEIEEIELTFMPEHVTIIYNGNTKFIVYGKEFSREKWNGITIQRIENSKKQSDNMSKTIIEEA